MDIKLTKEISKPLIIEGFPGFGLIGAITTEFLISHLDCEFIGEILLDDMPATIAIHEGKVVHPVGVYYNEKYNLIIVHSIAFPQGLEWKLADAIVSIAERTNAWELISLEGVGTNGTSDESNVYFFANKDENKDKLKGINLKELNEGIIIGVTSAILLKAKHMNLTAIFAEAHSQLPDSKAAAKIIEVLDKYLGLEVDNKPLLEAAEKFEDQIKNILNKSANTTNQRDKKALSYVG